MGDGGAVLSNSAELIEKVLQLANHGRSEQYFHVVAGVNSRLDSFQAAILRIKLRRLDQDNDRRRTIAEHYGKALSANDFISPPYVAPTSKHVFHLYCVETSFRDALVEHLKNNGIGFGIYYPSPLHLMPLFAHYGHRKGSFPISERVCERILALPLYPNLSDSDVETVCAALKSFSPLKKKAVL